LVDVLRRESAQRLQALCHEEAKRQSDLLAKIEARAYQTLDEDLVKVIRNHPGHFAGYYSAKSDWQVDVTPDTPLFTDFTVVMKDRSQHRLLKLAAMEAACLARGLVCVPLSPPGTSLSPTLHAFRNVGFRIQVPPVSSL
jgi:hypothetical protein